MTIDKEFAKILHLQLKNLIVSWREPFKSSKNLVTTLTPLTPLFYFAIIYYS